MSDIKFIKLPIEVIDHFWPEVAILFEKCFRRREQAHSVDDVYNCVISGEMQLWCAFADKKILGSVVTSVTGGSNGRKLSMVELAGDKLKDWIYMLDQQLTDFAAVNNCAIVEAVTRRGFSKFVPAFKIQNDAILHIKKVPTS